MPNIKKQLPLAVSFALYPALLLAGSYPVKDLPQEALPDSAQMTEASTPLASTAPVSASEASKKPLKLSSQELLANPALLKRAMRSVLQNQQIGGIRVILPLYRQLDDADAVSIAYGEALLAHHQGQLTEAISAYRQVMAKVPQLSVVRLNLAMALYADRQSAAARDQLQRLQSEELPPSVANMVSQTIQRIDREEDWQLDANFYYRHENNVNNAPREREIFYGGGKWVLPEPEKAHGIHLSVAAKKRFNLDNHLYSNLQFNASSDFFWDNHDYDDLSLRAGVGLGYQTGTFSAEIQPFVKKRFYGTSPYSLNAGASGHFSYRFSPQWRVSNQWEWSYERVTDRTFLNGQRRFVGLSANYFANAQQYWSAGVNYYDSQARDKSDAYHRAGLFIGWGQEWGKGLSSNVTLSAAKRHYRGVGFPNIKRADKEYSARLALWHRGIHYWGITPRLVWSWSQTDSNHFYYNQQKNNVNIEFSKTF